MWELIFFVSLALCFYTYAGYPLLLIPLSHKKVKLPQPNSGNHYTFVTVIICAHNESHQIVQRLKNISEQNYPLEKLDVLVISDHSSDGTVEITKKFSATSPVKIEVLTNNSTTGKPACLNLGMQHATGEIIVLADCRQTFEANAISAMTEQFSDSKIGAVSGELVFFDEKNNIQSMGTYWKYEKWIRKAESKFASTVGVTGAIYALRRKLYKPIPNDTLLDDVLIPMQVVLDGYQVKFIDNAIAYDNISQNIGQEWRRKVRTLTGNWQLLILNKNLIRYRRNPIFWQFISHKLFRLCVPFCLMFILSSSFILDGAIYGMAFYLQLLFYMTAITCAFIPSLRKSRLLSLIYFFTVMNAAAAISLYYFIRGDYQKLWRSDK